MTGDMVLALGQATTDGRTLFGQNSGGPFRWAQALHRSVGRPHAPDETPMTSQLDLPQVRHTFTAVGSQPAGSWGYLHGVNEHLVAAGCVPLAGEATPVQTGLTGPDLVRLMIERSQTARQAVDLLIDLLGRE